MSLKHELIETGDRLFRQRSYFPLLFLPLFGIALADFSYPGGSETLDVLWELACAGVAAAGLALRAYTVGHAPRGTSGRNTRKQNADVLNTTGMYSIVRHPLYVGNALIWLAFAMFPRHLWLVATATLAFWIYYERIMLAEEEFLGARFGASFEAWAARTPAFIPDPGSWRPPALPFSWRAVLAREYPTWFGTFVTFYALEVAGDLVIGTTDFLNPGWILLLSLAVVLYVVLRAMKKRGLLAVDGR